MNSTRRKFALRFKIDPQKYPEHNPILMFPKRNIAAQLSTKPEERLSINHLGQRCGGKISFFVEGKLYKYPKFVDEKYDFTDTTYVWDFMYHLLMQCFEMFVENRGIMFSMAILDTSSSISFFIEKPDVRIIFHHRPSPRYQEIQIPDDLSRRSIPQYFNIVVPIDEFIEEIIEVSEQLINSLLQINPKLSNSDPIEKMRHWQNRLSKVLG